MPEVKDQMQEIKAALEKLKKTRDDFAQRIALEQGRKDNIFYTAQVYSQGAEGYLQGYLQRMLDQIKELRSHSSAVKEQIAKLREDWAEKETREIATASPKQSTEEILDIEKGSVGKAQAGLATLEKLHETITDYLDGQYVMVLTQYLIRVAGRYKGILFAMEDALNIPKLGGHFKNEMVLVKDLKAEWNEFETLQDKIINSINEWFQMYKKSVKAILHDEEGYEIFVASIKAFLQENKKDMDRLSVLIKKQCELRFNKSIEIADNILKLTRIQ